MLKIEKITSSNFKGLKHVEADLSEFTCVIGQNNAGKSSLLQSILIFIEGPKLPKDVYYDQNNNIVFTGTLKGIDEDVLRKLNPRHREKIEAFILNGEITFSRIYKPGEGGELKIRTIIPKEEKFQKRKIDEFFLKKNSSEVTAVLLEHYKEIADEDVLKSITTQGKAKELVLSYASSLPESEKINSDEPIPSGIDSSVKALFPEPIYIPAVKDLSDELKTKDSTSFGKILKVLLSVIEGELTDAKETFDALKKKLNRYMSEDGEHKDERVEYLRTVETTIQNNLSEIFDSVKIELEIPPPEIKSILSNTTIYANDGARSLVDYKGDGFKRAVTFSILQSYIQLSHSKMNGDENDGRDTAHYIFLFEEPELFLHPRAQNILFDALSKLSTKYQTIISSHSPTFFSSDETKTFIKMYKCNQTAGKPQSRCVTANLSDLSVKDKFQLISYETSNLAFFSDKIVLVEGDSELIVFPHLSKVIDAGWNFKSSSINITKSNGKGSFSRYSDFFGRFGTEVYVIADLDILLEDFDKLVPTDEERAVREHLLKIVDSLIKEENLKQDPSPKLLKSEIQRERSKRIYQSLIEARKNNDSEKIIDLLDEFFIFELTRPRMEVLKDSNYNEVLNTKRKLLDLLRRRNVFVLEKGAIEEYYPNSIVGSDKPTKAQNFCSNISLKEHLATCCDEVEYDGKNVNELELILSCIFN